MKTMQISSVRRYLSA